jgi:hypothetical protein
VQEGACWPSKTVNLSYDPQKVTLTKIEEVLDDIGLHGGEIAGRKVYE